MGQLFLVRHGQASLLEENYDRLSPLGEAQSQLLGQFWADRRTTFDEVYSGPAQRHLRCAEIVGKVFDSRNLPWQSPVVLASLAEFDAEIVLRKSVPILAEQDNEVCRLRSDFHEARGRHEAVRIFQKLFEVVISKWVHGEFECPDVEPWPRFTERVQEAIKQITEGSEKGKRIVAFTSGGPIAIAMQTALKSDLSTTLGLAAMNYNSAFSEFLFSGERFSLKSFNGTPHLTQPELFTHW